jgi:hypothetical protein
MRECVDFVIHVTSIKLNQKVPIAFAWRDLEKKMAEVQNRLRVSHYRDLLTKANFHILFWDAKVN